MLTLQQCENEKLFTKKMVTYSFLFLFAFLVGGFFGSLLEKYKMRSKALEQYVRSWNCQQLEEGNY